jgi:hypothetical protein
MLVKNAVRFVVLILSVALTSSTAHAQVISINFTGGSQVLAPTDEPGILPAPNWNNLGIGEDVLLQDDRGTLTTAVYTLVSAAGVYDLFHTPMTANPATNVLYSGGLFGSNVGGGEVTISITNIPYAFYDVIVYASADTTATNLLGITGGTDADGMTTFYYNSGGRTNDHATTLLMTTSTDPFHPTTGPAQYQVFSNLTDSTFTLTTSGSITNVLSNNVFGLQIVGL